MAAMWWLAGLLCVLCGISRAEDVLQALSKDQDLSKFYALVTQDDVVRTFLKKRTATVLAPTNRALERSTSSVQDQTQAASYHVLNLLAPKETFPVSQSPILAGAPPIYLTVKEPIEPLGEKEFYVNNAKILRTERFRTAGDQTQILYVIDEVLTPYVANTNTPAPDALKFLEQPSTYTITEPLALFASRVRSERQEQLFSKVGYHTFFVPVGGGLGDPKFQRIQDVDSWVVRGHVIQDAVLFLRPMVGGRTHHSAAHGEKVRVELSVRTRRDPGTGTEVYYARSNTLEPDIHLRKGVVMSRIVRANIPVANGVVHLIEDPLMVIYMDTWDFLQKERAVYSDFFQLISYSPEFRATLESSQEKTLFVPTNEAIRKLSPDKSAQLRSNVTIILNLLKLHMVMKSVSTEDVYQGRVNESYSADNRRKLYFKVRGEDQARVLTVAGGGVNATVVDPDIGAMDGIIHVVDRLLGMPYQTVLEKLETEPDLTISYRLAKESGWGHQLADLSQRYTFFVPSDQAWKKLELELPSEYKRLNMVSLYERNLKTILDRHLSKKADLSRQDLEKQDYIDMVGGTFRINQGYDYGEMIVEWEGVRASIVRYDVHATNGVLHVINTVLMKSRDLGRISSMGSSILSAPAAPLFAAALFLSALL